VTETALIHDTEAPEFEVLRGLFMHRVSNSKPATPLSLYLEKYVTHHVVDEPLIGIDRLKAEHEVSPTEGAAGAVM